MCHLPPPPQSNEDSVPIWAASTTVSPRSTGPPATATTAFSYRQTARPAKVSVHTCTDWGSGRAGGVVGGQWARLGRRKLERCKTGCGSTTRLTASGRGCGP